MITFIRDTREKDGHGFTWKKQKDIAGTIEQKLDTGDYSVVGYETKYVVERKESPGELITNLFSADSKRFMAEMERLASFKKAWIVCQFTLEQVHAEIAKIQGFNSWGGAKGFLKSQGKFRITFDAFLGYIASISIRYNVNFIFAGPEQTSFIFKKKITAKINPARDITKKLLLKAVKYDQELPKEVTAPA